MTSALKVHTRPRRGFSLIEMMWQLVILVVISLPMVMALNMQKDVLQKDQASTKNQTMVNALFSVVQPGDADWYHKYTVTAQGPYTYDSSNDKWTTPNVNGSKISIYCDPASPAVDSAGCTVDPNGNPGIKMNQPPFFTRTLSVTTDGKLHVALSLYDKAGSTTPFSQPSRDFDLGTYRILVNTAVPPYQANQPRLETPKTDAVGHVWFPDVHFQANGDSNTTDDRFNNTNRWSFIRQRYCPPSTTDVGTTSGTPTPALPFANYIKMQLPKGTSGVCGPTNANFNSWANYNFKVQPQAFYDVNLYFVLPTSMTVNKDCLTAAPPGTTSCALADIYLYNSGGTTTNNLAQFLNLDVNALAGGGDLGTTPANPKMGMFHTQVSIPANQTQLSVYIQPTMPTGGSPATSSINLSAVEVIRR